MEEIEYPDLKIKVIPQTPSLGAVVEGVDGRATLDADLVALLKDLLMQYKVIFFPAQSLSVDEQQDFANQFGEPFVDHINMSIDEPENPGMTRVGVVAHFHSDLMYMQEPPSWSMLQMNAVPPVGGDTMWADLVASYDDLSPVIRDFLDPLVGLFAVDRWYWNDEMYQKSYLGANGPLSHERIAELREASRPHEHPMVRLIPETGRKNYWVSARFTESIVGLSPLESRAVLNMLFQHQLNPKYVFRWRWSPGDIAFWDHRTTIHSGIADFGSAERHGQRASIRAEKPLPG